MSAEKATAVAFDELDDHHKYSRFLTIYRRLLLAGIASVKYLIVELSPLHWKPKIR